MSRLRTLLTKRLGNFGRPAQNLSEKDHAKSFIKQQKDEAAVDRKDLGLREVPLQNIVGSVGRYHDFDKQFRLKTDRKSARYQRIKEAFRLGKTLPPPQLYKIKDNQRALSQITGTDITFEEAAEDWYEFIYIPFINILNQHQILDAFPKRTRADLYVYVSYHQWDKDRTDRTYNAELVELLCSSMENFRVKVMEQSEHPFPELKRMTTAFVMISVKPKLENQIIEKLYAYNEVQEIHYVTADFDIIAKIVLERDLLSSDSEVIGQFLRNHIRKLPGVTWTQTIIPLSSKVKTPIDRLR